jgi:hypothetical protein
VCGEAVFQTRSGLLLPRCIQQLDALLRDKHIRRFQIAMCDAFLVRHFLGDNAVMASPVQHIPMSEDAYLEMLEKSIDKYEYWNGVAVAMAGALAEIYAGVDLPGRNSFSTE